MSSYAPRAYWDDLLGRDLSISGVGYPHLAKSFNAAMYRSLLASTSAALSRAGLEVPRRVLDIGSGTGVWVDFWRRRGAGEIVGVDLTQVAVDDLQRRYPGAKFERADVGIDDLSHLGRFDAISAMSVLLHVTDEQQFQRAVQHLGGLLAPGGRLVAIEPVVVNRWWGPPFGTSANSKARPLTQWLEVLDGAGLRLETLAPATCLLANAIDTRHRASSWALWRYWDALSLGIGPRERLGGAVGRLLLAADRVAVQVVRPGPSAKVMIIRPSCDVGGS